MLLSFSGDVVIQTIGGVIGAGLATWGVVATARRSGRTEKTAGEVKAQMLPNGGQSMRDQVDLANRRLTVHDERLERIDRTLNEVAGIVRAIHARQFGEDES